MQNVFSPSTPGAFLPYGGSTNGPAGGLGGKSPGHGNNHGGNGTGASPGFGLGGAGTLPVGGMNSLMRPVGNNCYVQCGTEVKKVNLPTGDGKCYVTFHHCVTFVSFLTSSNSTL